MRTKMRKLLAILVVALAIPTMSFAGGEGRYQMLNLYIENKPLITGVWVLDTKTGLLRWCGRDIKAGQENFDCSPTVDASK